MTVEEARAQEAADARERAAWLRGKLERDPVPEDAVLKAKLWDGLMLNIPDSLRMMSNGNVVLREGVAVPSHLSAETLRVHMLVGAASALLLSQAIYTAMTELEPAR